MVLVYIKMDLIFEETTLQILFDERDFSQLSEIIYNLGVKNPDIMGILLTGSLVQKIKLPNPSFLDIQTELAKTYQTIVGRAKRRLWPHLESDLDLWICTKDPENGDNFSQIIDERGISLIEQLSSNPAMPLEDWIGKKRNAFDEFYKKVNLYSDCWLRETPDRPWLAQHFEQQLMQEVENKFILLGEKVNYYFKKEFPSEFIEIRAYPSCVFHLRPEKIVLKGKTDRTPFSYYLQDWVRRDNNCLVLYSKESPSSEIIYPFNLDGRVPGQSIADHVGWTPHHVEECFYKGDKNESNR